MTNDEIISVARRHGATIYTNRAWKENPAIAMTMDKMLPMVAELLAGEREACAQTVLKIANEDAGNPYKQALRMGAAAIRARGQQ